MTPVISEAEDGGARAGESSISVSARRSGIALDDRRDEAGR
jgi:hypothetical protein